MYKVVCALLIGGVFLCAANNVAVVSGGVIMLAMGMILAKKWRL